MQGSPPPEKYKLPFIDWDRPPWNRWSFQRVSEFLPTAQIRKGEVVSLLEYNPVNIDELKFHDNMGHQRTVLEFLEDTYTDGFLIVKGDKVIHESYYNGMDKRTLHLCQSVSKSICATAGAKLIDDGLRFRVINYKNRVQDLNKNEVNILLTNLVNVINENIQVSFDTTNIS